MSEERQNPIVDIIGADKFSWLAESFSSNTTLSEVPQEILEPISRVKIAKRDFSSDPNAIIAIALLTFAYGIAGKMQEARHGSNDLMLIKVLAQSELDRRSGQRRLENPMWNRPVYELIAGEVGEKIRAERFMTNPVG